MCNNCITAIVTSRAAIREGQRRQRLDREVEAPILSVPDPTASNGGPGSKLKKNSQYTSLLNYASVHYCCLSAVIKY